MSPFAACYVIVPGNDKLARALIDTRPFKRCVLMNKKPVSIFSAGVAAGIRAMIRLNDLRYNKPGMRAGVG